MQNSSPAIPRLGIKEYDWWNEALHGVGRAGLATVFPQSIGIVPSTLPSIPDRSGTGIALMLYLRIRGKFHITPLPLLQASILEILTQYFSAQWFSCRVLSIRWLHIVSVVFLS
jgi:hypothetical protein